MKIRNVISKDVQLIKSGDTIRSAATDEGPRWTQCPRCRHR
jgi:hypothetical protein